VRTLVSKIKFLSISKDVKAAVAAGNYNAMTLGKKHKVSRETIRRVRDAKTWPGFLLLKQKRAVFDVNRSADNFEKAQKAGLNPVRRPAQEGKPGPVEYNRNMLEKVVNEILEPFVVNFVAKDQLDDAIEKVHERLDTQLYLINKKADKKRHWWNRR